MTNYTILRADGGVSRLNLADGADFQIALAKWAAIHGAPAAHYVTSEMTQQQVADVNASETSYNAAQAVLTNQKFRNDAKAIINSLGNDLAKVLRAEAAVLVDEINSLRRWVTSFKAEVAAASSLADLKTRVASLPNLPDRTLAQAKTAIINKIDGGTVD